MRNYNTPLGQDGITGLKTGSTAAAGGCVLLAARPQDGRGHVLIVAALFSQPGTAQTMLPAALKTGDQMMLALYSALHLTARHKPGRPQGRGPYTNKEDPARPKGAAA